MFDTLCRLSRRLLPLLLFTLCAALIGPTPARADDAAVQTTWRLLDYIAVDYSGAIQGGRVVSQGEYDEMREFSASVSRRLAALPANAARAGLIDAAQNLEAAVARRVEPAEVERIARDLASRLLVAYPVPLAPQTLPDLARGAQLYRENCAACHGLTGLADGPQARGLDPPAIAFADRDRARHRSLFGLYQVIGQGLEGTAMQSYAHLSDGDRWSLAFYSGTFAYPEALAAVGGQLWRDDDALRTRIANVEALVGLTPDALARQLGEPRAAAVTAYLRANPEALMRPSGSQSLTLARELLGQSLAAYRSGARDRATELALAAYLDGFEPVEAILNARDASLVARVEVAMGRLRAAIGGGAPVEEVARLNAEVDHLFTEADAALAPEAGGGASTFLGAFAILLREGLEALLIVVAMITFLKRADRRAMLRWVHLGWIAALVAGAATWWAANHLVTISGAGRELTEGFGSLLAAAVLLFVGIWMHGKAQAGAWQAYVKEKLDKALGRGSAWFLFGLAFIAVYREVFETILFFAAMGAQGDRLALAGGIAAATAALTMIAWAMLKLGARLPIAKFFAYSAALIAVLAVVLAGKGFAALQESGLIGVTPLSGFPRSELIGLYPTLETMLAQAGMIALLAAGWLWVRRKAPVAA